MDAHEPYRVHEEYLPDNTSVRQEALGFDWNLRSLEGGPQEEYENDVRAAYNASVAYLDDQIRHLFQELQDRNLLEDTLIMILGDHGQCLGEHGFWGHGTFLYEDLVHVPMMIDKPRLCPKANGLDTELFSLVDVPHLIGDVAGVEFEERTTSVQSGETSCEKARGLLIESHGVHENINNRTISASREGYRSVYSGPWRLRRNLDSNTVDVEAVSPTTMNPPQSRLEDLESRLTNELVSIELADMSTPSAAVTERLKQLGYR